VTDPIRVNPAWLRWARRTALMSRKRAAKELGVTEATLRQWEHDGEIRSELPQTDLCAMGQLYQRPYRYFFLPGRPPYCNPLHWAPFRWWHRAFMRRLARWRRTIVEKCGDD